jgi:hypothetical protein
LLHEIVWLSGEIGIKGFHMCRFRDCLVTAVAQSRDPGRRGLRLPRCEAGPTYSDQKSVTLKSGRCCCPNENPQRQAVLSYLSYRYCRCNGIGWLSATLLWLFRHMVLGFLSATGSSRSEKVLDHPEIPFFGSRERRPVIQN